MPHQIPLLMYIRIQHRYCGPRSIQANILPRVKFRIQTRTFAIAPVLELRSRDVLPTTRRQNITRTTGGIAAPARGPLSYSPLPTSTRRASIRCRFRSWSGSILAELERRWCSIAKWPRKRLIESADGCMPATIVVNFVQFEFGRQSTDDRPQPVLGDRREV